MNYPGWFHNLAAYSFQVSVVATVGTLLPVIARLQIPIVLHTYWRLLLAGCVVLPAIQPWREPAALAPGDLSSYPVWLANTVTRQTTGIVRF